MGKSDVKVLGVWASPFSLRVRMALSLNSVEYEFIEQNLAEKSELLLKANPVHKKIPVLIHDGKSICESLIIVQYIDEVWAANGPSILPCDPYDRATARFLASVIDEKLYPSVREIIISADENEKKAAINETHRVLALLENAFTNCSKGFFGGDQIGYLDIAFGGFFPWIQVIEKVADLSLICESKVPNLFRWAQLFCAHDAIKDVLPQSDKMLEFAKSYEARFKKTN